MRQVAVTGRLRGGRDTMSVTGTVPVVVIAGVSERCGEDHPDA